MAMVNPNSITPNFKSDDEREKYAIYVINLMLTHKLFPKYDDFTVFVNIGKLPKEERSKAYEVQGMIKKVLNEHRFTTQGDFDDDLKMLDEGRKLILLGSYEKYYSEETKKQELQDTLTWYQSALAKQQFEDYPNIKKLATEANRTSRKNLRVTKWAVGISALMLLITMLVILLSRYKVWPFDSLSTPQ
jgi:hypothetical protein